MTITKAQFFHTVRAGKERIYQTFTQYTQTTSQKPQQPLHCLTGPGQYPTLAVHTTVHTPQQDGKNTLQLLDTFVSLLFVEQLCLTNEQRW